MFGTVNSFLTIFINSGSSWYFLVNSNISFDIVAEKKVVCLSAGVCSNINSISSLNPISSISSASSRTNIFTSSIFKVLRFIWSITRPGVPITTCTPLFNDFICLSIGCPP